MTANATKLQQRRRRATHILSPIAFIFFGETNDSATRCSPGNQSEMIAVTVAIAIGVGT